MGDLALALIAGPVRFLGGTPNIRFRETIREQNPAPAVSLYQILSMYFAKQLLSSQVVIGYPHQRLEGISEQIIAHHAQVCAVVKPRTRALLGLVRFSEIVGKPTITNRILADLMFAPPVQRLCESDGVEKVVELLFENDPSEVVIEEEDGAFAGLITPESFIRWLVAAGPARETIVERLPANSPWNPLPASLHELDWKTG